jgi:hypothetical protein
MSADTIARLKIALDEVKVAVLRWIEVPLAISEWIGDGLVPHVVDADELAGAASARARRWS